MNRNKKTILIATIAVISLAVFAWYAREKEYRYTTTTYTSGSYVVNPSNTRVLVGWSSHVFVAKVIKIEGSENESSRRPRTFFLAEVLERIKGDLPQNITLAQFASLQNNVLLIEKCEQFLQSDETYLFVTKYDATTKTYSIVSGGYGNIPITSEEQKAQLIALFVEAYHNELPFDPNNPQYNGSDESNPIYPEPYPFEIACHDDVSGSYTPPTPLVPEPTSAPIQLISPLPTPDLDPYPSP